MTRYLSEDERLALLNDAESQKWIKASMYAAKATTSNVVKAITDENRADAIAAYRTFKALPRSESDRLAALVARSTARTAVTQACIASLVAGSAPWAGSHNGGRKASPSTSADPYTASALYLTPTAPDGAVMADKANKGWAGAWQRKNTTRAGKSERRSMLVGSQHGAKRGEK